MGELVTKCHCCGADVFFADGVESRSCAYCHTVNQRPRTTDGGGLSLKRADQLRRDGRFAEAEEAYNAILNATPDIHEALWGLVLCRYGVEYMKDARSDKERPVCRTVHIRPLRLDADYQRACELAPESVRRQYEADATYIDNAQSRIQSMRYNGVKYDIFLSYKETDDRTGERTRDSADAQEIYDSLTREGYKVFFAPQSLRDKVGEDYEAAIYHAIETARLMLVIGSKKEYFQSVWVRSEWSCFLERIDAGEKKCLFPLYRNMQPDDLPKEFTMRRLQSKNMAQLSFMVDLHRAVKQCFQSYRKTVRPILIALAAILLLAAGGTALWFGALGRTTEPTVPQPPVETETAVPAADDTPASTDTPEPMDTIAPTDKPVPTDVPTVAQTAAPVATPWIDLSTDGGAQVSWQHFGSDSTYLLRYRLEGASAQWSDMNGAGIPGTTAALNHLVPGQTYAISVEHDGMSVSTSYTAPYAGAFTDFKDGIRVDIKLRYNVGEKREIARVGSSSREAFSVSDIEQHGDRDYFIYYVYDYPILGGTRTYDAKVAFRTPVGYCSYAYSQVLKMASGNSNVSGELRVKDMLQRVREDYGYVPTGTYEYELYVGDALAGTASFEVID